MFIGKDMISVQDKIWLKRVLEDCFYDIHNEDADEKKLKAFGMLVRGMLKNIQRNLHETQALWEKDAASKELREKFALLKQCLSYLERYCIDKIEGGKKNG